jgi:hypothetical protein
LNCWCWRQQACLRGRQKVLYRVQLRWGEVLLLCHIAKSDKGRRARKRVSSPSVTDARQGLGRVASWRLMTARFFRFAGGLHRTPTNNFSKYHNGSLAQTSGCLTAASCSEECSVYAPTQPFYRPRVPIVAELSFSCHDIGKLHQQQVQQQ